MRFSHFEYYAPQCPLCIQQQQGFHPLDLHVHNGNKEWIEEGNFVCNNCGAIYPVIRGIPILVPQVGTYLQQYYLHTLWDTNTTKHHWQWLSEGSGANSIISSTRSYISTYMHSHYGDLDPEEVNKRNQIAELLSNTAQTACAEGPVLDVGCSVGRSTFWLAEQHKRPVLGLDLNFAMLMHAQDALRHNRVRYGLRRNGVVYDWKEYEVEFAGAGWVDFWVADATCLPFVNGRIGRANTLNVLDCTTSPTQYLQELSRTSTEWHSFCPYDWSSAVTEFAQWLGGHSSYSPWKGSPEEVIRYLLSEENPDPILSKHRIHREIPSLHWDVRLHARSTTHYQVHYIHAVHQDFHPAPIADTGS